ncbi:MAG: hypothetical protein WA802_13000 [Terracidiphilus sp.]
MRKPSNVVAAIGLVLGGVLGMAGTMVTQQNIRAIAWGIDSTALVVATCLLAIRYFRKGNDCVAAGFLVYAIGEGVMLGGTAGTLEASVPSFAAGTAIWAAGLLLTGIPKEFALWTRTASIVGGVLFAIVAVKIFLGAQVLPTTSPLPYFAYPFLVLSFAGWFWSLLKAE